MKPTELIATIDQSGELNQDFKKPTLIVSDENNRDVNNNDEHCENNANNNDVLCNNDDDDGEDSEDEEENEEEDEDDDDFAEFSNQFNEHFKDGKATLFVSSNAPNALIIPEKRVDLNNSVSLHYDSLLLLLFLLLLI